MSRVATAAVLRAAQVLGAAFLLATAPGSAAEQARIVAARTGAHPDFDRVVIELDREVEVRRLPGEPGGVGLQIAAEPRQAVITLGVPRSRMGLIELRGGAEGTRVRVPARPRAVRVFRLRDPPRIVIDLGAPGVAALEVPPGVEALVEPEPSEPEIAEAPPPAEPEIAEAPPAPPAPETAPRIEVPEPAPPAEVAPPPPAQTPRRPPPETPAGEGWVSVLVWALVVVALAGVGGWAFLRRRSHPQDDAALESDEEDAGELAITPAELAHSADRVDVLEKRLDDEVRARMQIEERLVQTQEDLKVLRDRLHRAGRGGEPSA